MKYYFDKVLVVTTFILILGVDKKPRVICADTRFYAKPMLGGRSANDGAHTPIFFE
jgi:hypothetical protein